jgi:hypothetical protein
MDFQLLRRWFSEDTPCPSNRSYEIKITAFYYGEKLDGSIVLYSKLHIREENHISMMAPRLCLFSHRKYVTKADVNILRMAYIVRVNNLRL